MAKKKPQPAPAPNPELTQAIENGALITPSMACFGYPADAPEEAKETPEPSAPEEPAPAPETPAPEPAPAE